MQIQKFSMSFTMLWTSKQFNNSQHNKSTTSIQQPHISNHNDVHMQHPATLYIFSPLLGLNLLDKQCNLRSIALFFYHFLMYSRFYHQMLFYITLFHQISLPSATTNQELHPCFFRFVLEILNLVKIHQTLPPVTITVPPR